MSKSKIVLLIIIFCFMSCALFGTAYSAWVCSDEASSGSTVLANVPTWTFDYDTDFAMIDNVYSCSNLVATRETSLTYGSYEAIRITSTTGTSTKDHIINIDFDRAYTLSEIRYYKFEFNYYHRYKREQYTLGIPSVQFMYNHSGISGAFTQGGTDTCVATSAFNVAQIDDDWWHLEYYIPAHLPTYCNASRGNKPVALNQLINGVRIVDKYMYDYNGTTAFAIIDNMRFSEEPASRIGVYNTYTSDKVGKYFWLKVAFAGEPNSCVITSSNPDVAEPEFAADDIVSTTNPYPNGSPFYVYLKSPGRVTFTITMDLGPNHTILTASYSLQVVAA